jgi:hypothetical protein
VPRLIHMRDGRLTQDERRVGGGQFGADTQRGIAPGPEDIVAGPEL